MDSQGDKYGQISLVPRLSALKWNSARGPGNEATFRLQFMLILHVSSIAHLHIIDFTWHGNGS